MQRTVPALLLTGALLATSCTGLSPGPDDPAAGAVVVSDEPGALEAMADTLAGSFRWTGTVVLDLDHDEIRTTVDRVADQTGQPVPDDVAVWLSELGEYEDRAAAHAAHGALADDGSWQVAFDHDGDTWLDLRFGLGELLDAETTTPDATILARVGWDALFTMIGDLDEAAGDWDVRDEMRATATDSPDAGTPFADVLLALADGNWGGLAGTVDLGQFGVAAADLDAQAERFRREFAGVADRDTMLDLADQALTVRGYDRRGDLTVATVDVHPRAAAFAIYDLFDDAADMAATDPESLPETVEGVATVTFDGPGRLVEVRSDLVALFAVALEADADRMEARQTEMLSDAAVDHTDDIAELRAAAQALRDLENSSAAVVFAMSDHGQVPTVTDVDAVTMPWGELAEFFFGDLYDEQPTAARSSEATGSTAGRRGDAPSSGGATNGRSTSKTPAIGSSGGGFVRGPRWT